jgi:membrane protein implicated in regulation of membrane protease activity
MAVDLLWIVLGVGGILADLHSGALAGIWIAGAALLAAAGGALGLPPAGQAAVWVAAAVAGLLLGRPLLRRRLTRSALPLPMLVGKLGTAIDPLDDRLASGRVVIEGTPYVARLQPGRAPLPVGAAVRVAAVEDGDVVVEAL